MRILGCMTFIRKKENFTCGHCKAVVVGNGYTNHCPHCLWSQHVDIDPGDRAADCGCLMAPIHIEINGDRYIVTHRCEQCGCEKRNRLAEGDNFERVLAIVQRKSTLESRGN